jgi:ERCC4-type nuclease
MMPEQIPIPIVVDTREQTPLFLNKSELSEIRELDSEEGKAVCLPDRYQLHSDVKIWRGGLYCGDYSVLGCEHLFAVERKSIPDIVASVTWQRERFERECVKLRGFNFRRLLIVGTEKDIVGGNYRSNANPKAVYSTLGFFEVRYDLPVVFCKNEAEAEYRIKRWARYFCRETAKNAHELTKKRKT